MTAESTAAMVTADMFTTVIEAMLGAIPARHRRPALEAARAALQAVPEPRRPAAPFRAWGRFPGVAGRIHFFRVYSDRAARVCDGWVEETTIDEQEAERGVRCRRCLGMVARWGEAKA